jgi:tyrocidine synthetase III
VRTMISAGEAANVKDAMYYGSIKSYYNSYGPSEATVCSTQYKVESGRNYERIPIGKPGYNKQVYVLDKENQLVGTGITGEICIAGEGLAKEYLNQPELTREKFIQNPYGPGRLYKTGDLGRWQADGNLEYLGRKDSQVKLRGYRIELGEIEEVLQSHEGVEQAVVIIRGEGSTAELTAYIQSKEEGIEKELKTHLSTYLPQYMIPTEIIRLEVFPVTSNGKVDRRELAARTTKGTQRKETYVAPRNKVEEQLAKIWEEVLGIEKVGIDENFFELGGNSLKIVQIFKRINDEYPTNVSVSKLFMYNTIQQQSDFIHQKMEVVPEQKDQLTEIEF